MTYLGIVVHHFTTLEYAETPCNTLQHTATHCNTLQHMSYCVRRSFPHTEFWSTCVRFRYVVCLSVCLSICLYVCLSVCLCLSVSVYLSVCLSVCLSVWPNRCSCPGPKRQVHRARIYCMALEPSLKQERFLEKAALHGVFRQGDHFG